MGWTIIRPGAAIVDNLLTKSYVKDPDPADPELAPPGTYNWEDEVEDDEWEYYEDDDEDDDDEGYHALGKCPCEDDDCVTARAQMGVILTQLDLDRARRAGLV